MVRLVILGSGGVGGVIGGRLFQAGHDVLLVARGAHREVIARHGLRIEDPDAQTALPIPVVGSPSEISYTSHDVVILATKTQDANTALEDLRLHAPTSIPIVCATNGVEAERIAMRRFRHVYALNVMMPTAFLEPGVVQVISAPISGGLDIGRYPSGIDELTTKLANAFSGATFSSDPLPDIMRFKYRKLVLNTANAVEALCDPSPATTSLINMAAEEAERVFRVANLAVATVEEQEPKRALMVYRPINGKRRGGGSTWQSVMKGGSIETDYLNGEVVLLGRQHEVPTPINEGLQQAMHDLMRNGEAPGSRDAAALIHSLTKPEPPRQ
jgi:2-dehydropantoate 2-reductase